MTAMWTVDLETEPDNPVKIHIDAITGAGRKVGDVIRAAAEQVDIRILHLYVVLLYRGGYNRTRIYRIEFGFVIRVMKH